MPLYRPTYLVEYDPTAEPITVAVSSGDMMRGELEATKLRLPDKAPFHTTALWLWSALVRAGLEDRKAAEFIADPPEFEPVKRADGEVAVEVVDPTQESGLSDSDVPPPTVTPDSGLTLT
jgi:hypothetical protein